MEDFPVANRIKAVIAALGLSDSQFADRCGISRSTLSLLLSGKNKKMSDIMLTQIHDAFPKVSIIWILFGEGEMFVNDIVNEKQADENNENQIFRRSGEINEEELNLVNLKQLENIIKEVVNKSFELSQKDLEKLVLKITEPGKLRKASRITVYYDDSTFESFVPDKNDGKLQLY